MTNNEFKTWFDGFVMAVGPNRVPTLEQWNALKKAFGEHFKIGEAWVTPGPFITPLPHITPTTPWGDPVTYRGVGIGLSTVGGMLYNNNEQLLTEREDPLGQGAISIGN